MNPSVVSKQISKLVSLNIDSVDYAITDNDRIQMIVSDLAVVDVDSIKYMAVAGEFKKQKNLRSIERQSQDSLFSKDLMNVLIPFTADGGEPSSVKYEHATLWVHEQSYANALKDLENKKKAIERKEKRREVFMPLLRDNPSMTTGDALRQLGMYPGVFESESIAA